MKKKTKKRNNKKNRILKRRRTAKMLGGEYGDFEGEGSMNPLLRGVDSAKKPVAPLPLPDDLQLPLPTPLSDEDLLALNGLNISPYAEPPNGSFIPDQIEVPLAKSISRSNVDDSKVYDATVYEGSPSSITKPNGRGRVTHIIRPGLGIVIIGDFNNEFINKDTNLVIYFGELNDQGEFNGNGILYAKTGTVFKGEFKNGSIEGMGTMDYCEGVNYTGYWEKNVWSGMGICKNSEMLDGQEGSTKLLNPEYVIKYGVFGKNEKGRVNLLRGTMVTLPYALKVENEIVSAVGEIKTFFPPISFAAGKDIQAEYNQALRNDPTFYQETKGQIDTNMQPILLALESIIAEITETPSLKTLLDWANKMIQYRRYLHNKLTVENENSYRKFKSKKTDSNGKTTYVRSRRGLYPDSAYPDSIIDQRRAQRAIDLYDQAKMALQESDALPGVFAANKEKFLAIYKKHPQGFSPHIFSHDYLKSQI